MDHVLGELGTPIPVKKKRGFATLSKERVREIASKGGKSAHEQGTAHEFTSEEAKAAGRKGGLAMHRKYPGRTQEIGRMGGRARAENAHLTKEGSKA